MLRRKPVPKTYTLSTVALFFAWVFAIATMAALTGKIISRTLGL